MKVVFKLYLRIVLLLKRLYPKRNSENTANVITLAVVLFLFNIFSILTFLNYSFDLIQVEYNSNLIYRGPKVLVTVLIAFLFLGLMEATRKRYKATDRYTLYKGLIKKNPSLTVAIIYLVTTLTAFLLATTILLFL